VPPAALFNRRLHDKIRKPDRGKMKPLIEDLARIVARNNGPEDIGYFWCSAVTSTKPLPGDERGLVGRPMWMPEGYRPPEEKPHEVIVPALPERWPLGVWKAEDYVFTDFYPAIPPARYQPPLQLGLDEVLKFVIGV
jgi:hypothetical protein